MQGSFVGNKQANKQKYAWSLTLPYGNYSIWGMVNPLS